MNDIIFLCVERHCRGDYDILFTIIYDRCPYDKYLYTIIMPLRFDSFRNEKMGYFSRAQWEF